jgi:hypothetical protein
VGKAQADHRQDIASEVFIRRVKERVVHDQPGEGASDWAEKVMGDLAGPLICPLLHLLLCPLIVGDLAGREGGEDNHGILQGGAGQTERAAVHETVRLNEAIRNGDPLA